MSLCRPGALNVPCCSTLCHKLSALKVFTWHARSFMTWSSHLPCGIFLTLIFVFGMVAQMFRLHVNLQWTQNHENSKPISDARKLNTIHSKRVWSSGYDVRLTRERSWVRSSLPVCQYASCSSLPWSLNAMMNIKLAGALPAGSWISVIMFPRHRRLTHTTTSLIHLTLCLLSAFHSCHHQSDHSSSKAERQWCSHVLEIFHAI